MKRALVIGLVLLGLPMLVYGAQTSPGLGPGGGGGGGDHTASSTTTLTNKWIDGDNNTIKVMRVNSCQGLSETAAVVQDELCFSTSTSQLWMCKDPAGGTNSSFCDAGPDWMRVGFNDVTTISPNGIGLGLNQWLAFDDPIGGLLFHVDPVDGSGGTAKFYADGDPASGEEPHIIFPMTALTDGDYLVAYDTDLALKADIADIAVTTAGNDSPEGVVTCVAKPCFYVQQNAQPVATTWVFNGTNGTAVGWSRLNNNMQSHAEPVNVSLQDCTSGGICPNPRGAFIIDPWVFWAGMTGGQRDTDGSMYSALCIGGTDTGNACSVDATSSACITGGGVCGYNAITDFIASVTTTTLAATSAQWSRTLTVPTTFDPSICRGSVNFEPCTDTATGGGTCTVSVSSPSPDAFVAYDVATDSYAPLLISAYNGCTNASQSVTTINGLPFALDSGDSIQRWATDGLHPYTYYHRWLADLVLNSSEEFAFFPSQNLLTNGDADTSCIGGTNGWTKNSGGTLNSAGPDTTNDSGGNHATRGANNCRLESRAAATDGIQPSTFATQAGQVYVAKGFLRINSTTNKPIIQVFDQGGTALNTSEVQAWHILATDPINWASETASSAECYEHCFVIVKFRAGAAQTTATIRVTSDNGTDNIVADEWTVFPAPTQNLALNPLIKDGAAQFRIEGDSRSNALTTPDFPYEFDVRAALVRPKLKLVSPLVDAISASGGRRVDTGIVDLDYASIRGTASDYTLLYMGLNDTVADRTAAQLAADIRSTIAEIRMAGSTPIVLLDPPFASNVDSGAWTTGCNSTYCALSTGDMIQALTQDPGPY